MKRKITKLERNLDEIGFSLENKIYTGHNRDRVFGYVYKFSEIDGETYDRVTYEVTLDNKREKISYYCFTTRNSSENYYNRMRLEKLQDYMNWLEQILSEIYDFKNECAIDYEITTVFDYEEPITDNYYFDEED